MFFTSLGRSAVCSILCSKFLGFGAIFTGGVDIELAPLPAPGKPIDAYDIKLPKIGRPSSANFCPSR